MVLLLGLYAELNDDKLTADWSALVTMKVSGASVIAYLGLLALVSVPRVIV
jgi:hypothetical protein